MRTPATTSRESVNNKTRRQNDRAKFKQYYFFEYQRNDLFYLSICDMPMRSNQFQKVFFFAFFHFIFCFQFVSFVGMLALHQRQQHSYRLHVVPCQTVDGSRREMSTKSIRKMKMTEKISQQRIRNWLKFEFSAFLYFILANGEK